MEVQTCEALFDHLTQLGPRRPHLWIEHIHTSKNALEAEARSCPHGRVVPAPGAVSSPSAMPSEGACGGTELEAAVALGPSNPETMGPESATVDSMASGCAERSRVMVSPERWREARAFGGADLRRLAGVLFLSHCG